MLLGSLSLSRTFAGWLVGSQGGSDWLEVSTEQVSCARQQLLRMDSTLCPPLAHLCLSVADGVSYIAKTPCPFFFANRTRILHLSKGCPEDRMFSLIGLFPSEMWSQVWGSNCSWFNRFVLYRSRFWQHSRQKHFTAHLLFLYYGSFVTFFPPRSLKFKKVSLRGACLAQLV